MYNGPEFMQIHFYPISSNLNVILPDHNIHQGIQCHCGHKKLSILKRLDNPTIFAQCQICKSEFKIYENQDYLAGYISDTPDNPLITITL